MKRALLGILWLAAFLMAGPARGQEPPRIDVAFLIDATGSMGDEIDAVKEKIQDMISDIALGDPAPDVRFGIVAYRDRGDEYVTVVYELTDDIDRIIDNLSRIEANGGGDYPESLVEALHVTIHDLNWDRGEGVSRLVFLIADAPPHLDYAGDYDYVEEYQMAEEMGMAIHAIGASGLDQEGEKIFTEIAEGTGGGFQWLAYESRYVDQDGEEVIVVIEGRTATYSKGDSTWTVEDGGMGGIRLGGAIGYEEDGAFFGPEAAVDKAFDDVGGVVPTMASGGAGAAASAVETSTNLADLVTGAVREAAEEKGVDYGVTTAVEEASWGEIKKQER
ncbi:MAG: VWA domain-containing protein [Gemmatimonadetes bacterium]|jgi:uncharacterized protein YegL|nr:VWA domain-containing protein [Gemmatimonadota bacterium]